jgi:hypothetical protein
VKNEKGLVQKRSISVANSSSQASGSGRRGVAVPFALLTGTSVSGISITPLD